MPPWGEETEPVTFSPFCWSSRVKGVSSCSPAWGPPWDVHSQVPVSSPGSVFSSFAKARPDMLKITNPTPAKLKTRFIRDAPSRIDVCLRRKEPLEFSRRRKGTTTDSTAVLREHPENRRSNRISRRAALEPEVPGRIDERMSEGRG